MNTNRTHIPDGVETPLFFLTCFPFISGVTLNETYTFAKRTLGFAGPRELTETRGVRRGPEERQGNGASWSRDPTVNPEDVPPE